MTVAVGLDPHAHPQSETRKDTTDEETIDSRLRQFGTFLRRIWPLLLGNVLQWYEFGVYGSLVPQMRANFFKGSQLAAWCGYAVTFVGRPVGGFVFGWMADTFGRRFATMASLLGMLIATVGQGMLPSESCCGPQWGRVGLIVLIFFRCLQGFCTGGEEASIMPYIMELAPKNIKCLACSVFMATICASFLLSSFVVCVLVAIFDEEQMLLWGWRIPFLLSAIPGFISLWGRHGLAETPEFLAWQQRRQQENIVATATQTDQVTACLVRENSSFLSLCRRYRGPIALMFFGSAGAAVSLYQALWQVDHLKNQGLSEKWALTASSMMQVVIIITIFGTASLSDAKKIGPLVPTLVGTLLFTVVWLPIYSIVGSFPSNPIAVVATVALGYGPVIGISLGTFHFFFVGLFPMEVRAKLFGVTTNCSLAVFGGFAGVISQEALRLTSIGPAIYAVCLGLISSIALLWAYRLEGMGNMRMHHFSVDTSSASESSSSREV